MADEAKRRDRRPWHVAAVAPSATTPTTPIYRPQPAEASAATPDGANRDAGRRARTAANIMRRHVMTAREETPAAFVLGLLTRSHFSQLPIVDATGQLIGVVTDYNLISCGWGPEAVGAKLAGRQARDLMKPVEAVVEESTPLHQVADLMRSHAMESLLVIRDGRVVGVVGRSELLEALAASLFEQRD